MNDEQRLQLLRALGDASAAIVTQVMADLAETQPEAAQRIAGACMVGQGHVKLAIDTATPLLVLVTYHEGGAPPAILATIGAAAGADGQLQA